MLILWEKLKEIGKFLPGVLPFSVLIDIDYVLEYYVARTNQLLCWNRIRKNLALWREQEREGAEKCGQNHSKRQWNGKTKNNFY